MDGRMDGLTDQRINGRTKRGVESRSTRLKSEYRKKEKKKKKEQKTFYARNRSTLIRPYSFYCLFWLELLNPLTAADNPSLPFSLFTSFHFSHFFRVSSCVVLVILSIYTYYAFNSLSMFKHCWSENVSPASLFKTWDKGVI